MMMQRVGRISEREWRSRQAEEERESPRRSRRMGTLSPFYFLGAVLFMLLLAPVSTTAQEAIGGVDVDQAAQVGEPAQPSAAPPGIVPETTSSAPTVPVRAQSMRVYWHVFGAFGLTWLLLFLYVVSLGRRFAQLEREVSTLGGMTSGTRR